MSYNAMTWVIPMNELANENIPTLTLNHRFHFRPRSLIEAVTCEWFRYRSRQGLYGMSHVFDVDASMILDLLKPEFLLPEDVIVNRSSLAQMELEIDVTGREVMNTLASYTQALGIDAEVPRLVDIQGWCGKCLIVRIG